MVSSSPDSRLNKHISKRMASMQGCQIFRNDRKNSELGLFSNYFPNFNSFRISRFTLQLQIRKNSSIPCNNFYKSIISQQDLLKAIATNDKFETKKRIYNQ